MAAERRHGEDPGGDTQPVADNWANRADGMRCRTCIWFVPKEAPFQGRGNTLGRCRRHAPTLTGWPAIFDTDWCGDHKLKELNPF